MTKLVAALFQLAVFGQDTMHGAHRAEVGTFVQKGGIDLDRSLVPEAFRVQLIEYRLPFLRIERARWRQPDPVHGSGLQATVQRGPGYSEGAAGCCHTRTSSQLENRAHSFSSPIWIFGIGLPSRAATFFCTSIINSAFFRRWVRRVLMASSLRFSRCRGLTTALGPRLFGAMASSSPCRRWRRQVDKCEEYSPSRRSK